ncbi:hypothetical protein SAMN04488029_2848 [Reichenbachiella faecimaris]|uniref:F5/8 type C domain-containing protein n=1 Tax=Reichenbachiella faecimaris TaxID=692418 RepID=A0A1W2GJB4_REIFA|nr:hypothetical protein [Reichenbachiella faecimaris]SMD36356.1 hypothetical protein SAMN04488029_2848 [Reichenbachiella faecimaris]
MKRLTILTLTFSLIFLFPILESCDDEGCGSSTIYYDYSSVEFEVSKSYGNEEDYFYFMVSTIIDPQSQLPFFSFGSSLLAEALTFLPKYKIEKIEILSNKSFDSSNSNTLNITTHFEVYSQREQEWVSINQASFQEGEVLFIRCPIRSENMDQTYDLKIEITKSNKQVASGLLTNFAFNK